MSKQRRVFTDSWARSVKPPAAGLDTGDAACPGLRLVAKGHRRYWRVRIKLASGSTVKRDLGPVSTMTVTQARGHVEALRSLTRAGNDIDDALIQRGLRTAPEVDQTDAITVASVLDAFITFQTPRVRGTTLTGYERDVKRAKDEGLVDPASGDPKISDPLLITRAAARAYIEYQHRERGYRSAGKMHSTLRAAFNHAIDSDILMANPFGGWKRGDLAPLKAKVRQGYIPMDELGDAWLTLEEKATPEARVAQLCLLTGARSGEIVQLKWADVGEDAITIPADVAKQGIELVHLLPDAGMEILQAQRATLGRGRHRYVFPADTETGHLRQDHTSKAISDLIGVGGHDLRRTVRTSLKQLGCPPEVRDRITCHASIQQGAGQVHYEIDDVEQLETDAREWLADYVAEFIPEAEED